MSDQKQSSNGGNAQPSNDNKPSTEQSTKDLTTKRIFVGDSAKSIKKGNK